MKIECTQANLQRGLGLVGRMVGTRATLPVLANILFKTEKGRLQLSATDLEMGISTFIGAKVDKEGSVTLPARLLTEFISTNTDEKMTIEVKDNDAVIYSKHYKATIKGIAASEFPTIPEISPEFEAEINGNDFKTAITQTVFAAALDETRPVLAGVLLKAAGQEFKMAATDSFRLTEKTLKLDKKLSKESQVVVPARTMIELMRLIEDAGGNIRLTVGENQVAFSFGEVYLVSRVIEGAFPDYEQIIPQTIPTHSKVDRVELANAMKMSTLFARDSANNIKMKVSSKEIEVLATSPQLGENTSKIPADTKGEELDIAFNAKYILDILMVMGGKQVDLGFVGKLNPCVIQDATDKSYLAIVMPLRMET